MKALEKCIVSVICFAMLAGAETVAQAQKTVHEGRKDSNRQRGFSLMPPDKQIVENEGSFTIMASAPTLPVLGGGIVGRLPKLTGFTSSNTFVGNSTIFEDKNGLVGIGTDVPTSKLTVVGLIELQGAGGIKFPDGTITTSAGVAIPLKLEGSLPNVQPGILTVKNNGNGGYAIRAFGGDSNTGVYPGAGILSGGGNGTAGMTAGGPGVDAAGGRSLNSFGGPGVLAAGGDVNPGSTGPGGSGIVAAGGGAIFPGTNASGGEGVFTMGGTGKGFGFRGGAAIVAYAGTGLEGAPDGAAGVFFGDVDVFGDFSVSSGTKNFKMDHPLDPENRYLYHAAIESSEVLNIYSGNITTDNNGGAVVSLPDWFEALNRDFRYQLTVVGTFAQAIVADEINNNRFKIRTSAPDVKVSWQVTGIRSDPAMRLHPFRVEEDKPKSERGSFLVPEAYDQPEERSVEWARNPHIMRQRKQRIDAARKGVLDR